MSTWTAPITFVASNALTAAQLNTEVRDHALFLKGVLDLLTNTTTADTGNTMSMGVRVAAASSGAYFAFVTTDSVGRWAVTGDGRQQWGDGTAARDVELRRSAANTLQLDATDNFDLAATALALNLSGGGYAQLTERADLGNAPANSVWIWAADNGAGKTVLRCRFASGSIQQIAIEP
jgi:hypothetical protein